MDLEFLLLCGFSSGTPLPPMVQKNIHVRLTGDCKSPVGVSVSMAGCFVSFASVWLCDGCGPR